MNGVTRMSNHRPSDASRIGVFSASPVDRTRARSGSSVFEKSPRTTRADCDADGARGSMTNRLRARSL